MSMDRDNLSIEVSLDRYDRLEDRDHCALLNETVRNTMRLLSFLSITRYHPVQADDIAQATGLAPAFVDECLVTLQFDGFVRETDFGFQSELEVERMTWRSHRQLDRNLRDMGEEMFSVRSRSGNWNDGYYWPEGRQEFANLQTFGGQ